MKTKILITTMMLVFGCQAAGPANSSYPETATENSVWAIFSPTEIVALQKGDTIIKNEPLGLCYTAFLSIPFKYTKTFMVNTYVLVGGEPQIIKSRMIIQDIGSDWNWFFIVIGLLIISGVLQGYYRIKRKASLYFYLSTMAAMTAGGLIGMYVTTAIAKNFWDVMAKGILFGSCTGLVVFAIFMAIDIERRQKKAKKTLAKRKETPPIQIMAKATTGGLAAAFSGWIAGPTIVTNQSPPIWHYMLMCLITCLIGYGVYEIARYFWKGSRPIPVETDDPESKSLKTTHGFHDLSKF